MTESGEDRPGGRPARVRNRLVGAVAVVAAAVLGAGAPGLMATADNATHSQQLVGLAELNARAIALAHSLADERDGMTAYVATGRGSRTAAGLGTPPPTRRGPTTPRPPSPSAPAWTGRSTSCAPRPRTARAAPPRTRPPPNSWTRSRKPVKRRCPGPGSAEQIHSAYTQALQALGAIGDDIARGLPARAESTGADTRALPALGRAIEQAAGTRALLLAGLKAGGSQPRLTALAQVSHLREQGALGDFQQAASQAARDRYVRTVNGADVNTAERYLTRLTDQPRLDATDLRLNRQRVQETLTSRISLMRGVESAMATADIQRLGVLRDDEVTELEIRIGLEGCACCWPSAPASGPPAP